VSVTCFAAQLYRTTETTRQNWPIFITRLSSPLYW